MIKYKIDQVLSDVKNINNKIDKKMLISYINYHNNKDDIFLNESLSSINNLSISEIINKYKTINSNIILNHKTYKLSDLDMEIIKSVPQGGNWKDIPDNILRKSKRLVRISQTGGRTTLYGRIDYRKPSYTITTYFNRPGNGTYIHPKYNRVITAREAARFQTFQDKYYFYGNQNQILKQIGNAVPPVLAYQIAKKIISITKCKKSIDLFCGAGGLTVGFKEAGIKSVLSNDIDKAACVTLKLNNPEINVICDDITKKDVKKKIINTAKAEKADIICGGPPCQGFSLAGLRKSNDPRNKLFIDFIDIVKKVKPKIVIFENVEGITNFKNGQTYKTIIKMFNELGYIVEGKMLKTNEYGVPQKRKRLIIICVNKKLKITPSILFPEPITLEEKSQIQAFDVISDIEIGQIFDSAEYIENTKNNNFTKLMFGEQSVASYIKNIR